jgi:hypothetical protein
MERARTALRDGRSQDALEAAEEAWQRARTQRSHRLLSEGYAFLLDVMAETGLAEPARYHQAAEDAFYWAETMPEEIQVWLFHALRPHLLAVNLPRLEARAASRCEKAEAWLSRGNLNVATRVQALDIEDMARGWLSTIACALRNGRRRCYADELWDATGEVLRIVARSWRDAGRADRAEALEAIADEHARRGTP